MIAAQHYTPRVVLVPELSPNRLVLAGRTAPKRQRPAVEPASGKYWSACRADGSGQHACMCAYVRPFVRLSSCYMNAAGQPMEAPRLYWRRPRLRLVHANRLFISFLAARPSVILSPTQPLHLELRRPTEMPRRSSIRIKHG